MNGRLNLRMEADLLAEARAYARRRRLTLSALVRQHFVDLLEEEARSKVFDAEQV